MKKVLIIVGPTGSGKTGLSIKLAKKFDGEIISGDSIQVYQGLNIGSAKITEAEMEGIRHYGIDILSSKDSYNVYDFQKSARKYIDEISDKNKLPMIVGGTGLYIKACIYDYVFKDEEIDLKKIVEYEKRGNEDLYNELLKVDKKSAEKIHLNNRKRVIRALLIHHSGNKSKSEMESTQKKELLYDAFIVGCTIDRKILYERINQRVADMVNAGLKDEIKALLNQEVTFNHHSMQGIGYKEWKEYFEGKISEEEVIGLIQKHTRNFAKRQYTWFNNQMKINWVDMQNEKEVEEMINKIEVWYGSKIGKS